MCALLVLAFLWIATAIAAQSKWVLIAPPLPPGWRDDPANARVQLSVPISAWERIGAFDTRDQCELARYHQRSMIDAQSEPPYRKAVLLVVSAAYRCVQEEALRQAE
jgi:hypothetical protein